MNNGKAFPVPVRAAARARYSCNKCPAYCCSYPEIEVTRADVERLAKHFDLSYAAAEERFTKHDGKVRMLRHRQDRIFASVCTFLDQKKRRDLYMEATRIIHDEKPWLELFQEVILYGTSKRVAFKPRPDYRLIVSEMSLTR